LIWEKRRNYIVESCVCQGIVSIGYKNPAWKTIGFPGGVVQLY